MVLKGAVRFAFKFSPYGLDGEVCKTGQHRREGRTAHSVNMGGASGSQASDASGEHRYRDRLDLVLMELIASR